MLEAHVAVRLHVLRQVVHLQVQEVRHIAVEVLLHLLLQEVTRLEIRLPAVHGAIVLQVVAPVQVAVAAIHLVVVHVRVVAHIPEVAAVAADPLVGPPVVVAHLAQVEVEDNRRICF